MVHAWLASDSTATAVIMDLPRAWDPAAQAFLAAFTGRLAFFEGSVTEEAAWAGLSEQHGSAFTHVVSGAAVTPTRADEEAGAARILDVNLFGAIRALEFARSLPDLHRFVFVSSDAVYAPPGLVRPPLEGEEPQSSMALYSLSKFAGEKAVGRWAELFGLDATCVRFADVYGQLDRDTGARNRHNAPYWVCRQAVAGQPVRVQGALDDLGWDYIAAPDVGGALCALLRAAQRPALPVYVIGIGRPVPHAELLEAVFAAAPPGEGRPLLTVLSRPLLSGVFSRQPAWASRPRWRSWSSPGRSCRWRKTRRTWRRMTAATCTWPRCPSRTRCGSNPTTSRRSRRSSDGRPAR